MKAEAKEQACLKAQEDARIVEEMRLKSEDLEQARLKAEEEAHLAE